MASSRRSKAVHSEIKMETAADSADEGLRYDNVRCSELRVKGFVLIGGRPCKIVEMSSSKTGKHGSCKIHLVAIDVFTGKKRVTAYTSSDVVQVPLVEKRECQLVRIVMNNDDDSRDPGQLLVAEKSGSTATVGLCPDKAAQLLEATRHCIRDDNEYPVIVTVMSAMGEEAAVAVRRARERGK
ncbi:hypothetical protein BOX15_Mlig028547g1 [Macrostomum lignano]|uniref:Eukaryotic translation initiation factor 5A n=3 Tax=Macrostomum lignano TaxID=282301 RepID=A0A1I8G6F7_9PLAT|nr:hypothetical protein BOX15_Mlig028547g1 [Macrostomum lignano]